METEDMDYKTGDRIRIAVMVGEPRYAGREGVITHIDSLGQLHGTWGGLAVIPGEDAFEVIGTEGCSNAESEAAISS